MACFWVADALLVPAPLAPLMQEAGRQAFRQIHSGRSFLEDLSEQLLGEIHSDLLNVDEDENIICRDPSKAWHPDDVLDSKFLFS